MRKLTVSFDSLIFFAIAAAEALEGHAGPGGGAGGAPFAKVGGASRAVYSRRRPGSPLDHGVDAHGAAAQDLGVELVGPVSGPQAGGQEDRTLQEARQHRAPMGERGRLAEEGDPGDPVQPLPGPEAVPMDGEELSPLDALQELEHHLDAVGIVLQDAEVPVAVAPVELGDGVVREFSEIQDVRLHS